MEIEEFRKLALAAAKRLESEGFPNSAKAMEKIYAHSLSSGIVGQPKQELELRAKDDNYPPSAH